MILTEENLEVAVKALKSQPTLTESNLSTLRIPALRKFKFIKKFPFIRTYLIPHPKYFKPANIITRKKTIK